MNKEVKPTWDYILNDLALYSLFIKVAYSEDVPKQDKVDLEHQIKLLQQKVNQLETNRDETFKVINTQLKNANEYKDNLRIIKFHLIKGSCTFEDLKTEEDYQY